MKTIVITGASRGIGKELTQIFLENNHRVLAISRNEIELEKIKVANKNKKFEFIACDLSKQSDLDCAISRISKLKKIDILYNNAGHIKVKQFEDLSMKDFEDCLKVNFTSPTFLIQNLSNLMNGNGHIVNIGTMGAVQGSVKFGGLAAYSSSKAALANLTELLAEEWKDDAKKPKINYLAIGAVNTEMLKNAFPGYIAPLSSKEMAKYFYDFGLDGGKYFNGKILPVSLSTP